MGYHGPKRFKIDLGVAYARQPCDQHRQDGFDGDCQACERMPERQVPVPHLHGFWVEVLNPALLPYGEKKRLYTPVDETASPGEIEQRRERIITGLVTAWNLVAADAEGENPPVLPLPKDDAAALDRAPDVIGLVFVGLAREQRRTETVPKANATA